MRVLACWALAVASVVFLSPVVSAAEPPTGAIVYDLGDRLFIAALDGSDRRLLVRTPSARVNSGPVWSPDGSRIAFARGGALFVVTVAGKRLSRVANLRPFIGSIRWSPDGTRIAFDWATRRSCHDPGRSEVGLFVIAANGSGARELADVEKSLVPPRVARFFTAQEWSPSGKRILYRDDRYEQGECRAVYGRGSFLRHAPIAGGRPTSLPSGSSQARWSPDGSLLALDPAVGCSLSVVRPDGREPRLLLPDNQHQSCFEEGWIAWSPAGDDLYVARGDSIRAVRVADRRQRILMGDAGLCRDRDFSCSNRILALSKDGQRLLVEAEGGRRDERKLFLLLTDGTRTQRLAHPGLVPFAAYLG